MPCPGLSVVVPCYNEGSHIRHNLMRIAEFIEGLDIGRRELVAVNDGSTDTTLAELHLAQKQIPYLIVLDNGVNRGKGYSVRTGVMASHEDIVVFLDADFSIPPNHIADALQILDGKGSAIVVGSRLHRDAVLGGELPGFRVTMGRVFAALTHLILDIPEVRDTQCGFKVFAGRAKEIFRRQTVDRYAFDVELLYLAHKMSIPIYEMPVTCINRPMSSVRPIRDSIQTIVELLRIRAHHSRSRREPSTGPGS